MKRILALILILLFTINTYAKENGCFIDNVIISNGVISPKFDKYNNNYSVLIDKNETRLIFDFEYDDINYDINVINNDNLENGKVVYVIIKDKIDNIENTYSFQISIENEEKVFNEIEDPFIEKEQKNYAPYIGLGCFTIILILFYFIFLRKKSYIL